MQTPLDKIIHELTELATDLYEFLLRTETSPERPGWNQQLEQYIKRTLLIRLLAGQGDRVGLHDACMLQQEYLSALMAHGVVPTAHEWDRLERWPLLLLPCLATPVMEDAIDEVVTFLRNATCGTPLNEHDAHMLRKNLLSPVRAPRAAENNVVTLPVSRGLPAQPSQAVAETAVRYLLQHELLDTLTEYLAVAELPTVGPVEHAQALQLCADRIQLLGISAAGSELIGLMDCCLLCHDALIKRLNAHSHLSPKGREQLKIWSGLVAGYLDAPDSAETVDSLLTLYERGDFIPAMLSSEYARLRECLLLDTHRQAPPRIEIKALPERRSPPRQELPGEISARKKESAPIVTKTPQASKPNTAMRRVSAASIDDLLRLTGESVAMTHQLQNQLSLTLQQSKAGSAHYTALQNLLVKLAQQVDAEPENSNGLREVTQRIMEAVTHAQGALQAMSDQLGLLADLTPALARISKDSRDCALQTRKVPVSKVAARLQRSVREASRMSGKRVALTISGADLLLDGYMLDNLTNSLMQLLRNAIEHGIEPAELRRACGKSETGNIDVCFVHDADHLVVRCRDDGAGLDYSRIRQIARQQGVMAAGKEFTEAELIHAILSPGFMTRNATDSTIGNSLGAISKCIADMKGSLNISSSARQGCVVELRVPLALVSLHALLVRSRSQVLTISSRSVERIVGIGEGQVLLDGDRLQYRIDDNIYAAYEIEALLHLPMEYSAMNNIDRQALLVRDVTGHVRAVLVEQVLASHDVSLRPLGPYLPPILGIEGATILDNGCVAVVIDLPGLLQTAQPDQAVPAPLIES